MTQQDEIWLPPWDGAAYAANTAHHRAHDDWFLAAMPLTPTDRVLDVGCGSGDFTAKVAALVPGGHVVGLDPQPSLLDEARACASANQSFIEAPAQHIAALVEPGSFDVVCSRAALQWVPMADHPGILDGVFGALRPGGWYRLEMSGGGNIRLLLALLDDVSSSLGGPTSPWTFPDAGTYLELLEAAGFSLDGGHVRTVAQRRTFDEAAVVGWLRSQAFQAYELGLPPERHAALRAGVEGRLEEVRRHDGTFDQTFVRLDVLARRPA